MVVNLLLYHFNNYYNRKLIVYDDLADYGTPLHILQNVQSFNPGDGVSTSHVINHVNIDIDNVDYALVVVNNMIVSRWFVLDGTYTRNGQTILTLYRDTIAEKHVDIFRAPMFIEKATLRDSSPFIYNSEAITVNEIKKSETLLKDNTNCAWLVGYMARDYAGQSAVNFEANIVPDATYSDISAYQFRPWIDSEHKLLRKYTLSCEVDCTAVYHGTPFRTTYICTYDNSTDKWTSTYDNRTTIRNVPASYLQAAVTDINTWATHPSQIQIAMAQNGRILKLGDEFKKVVSVAGGTKNYSYPLTSDYQAYSVAYSVLPSLIPAGATINGVSMTMIAIASTWGYLTLEDISAGTYTTTIPEATGRYHLLDAPYDMFCMPYGDITIKNTQGTVFNLELNASLTLSIAQGLKAAMSANIYDIQLLPYCPLTGYSVESSGVINLNNSDTDAVTLVKTIGGVNVAPILWCTRSQSSLSIDYTFTVENKKMSTICDKLRFCSPNYAAVFEMSPAKNNGITGVVVDYTYMPFTPYIHVAPVFDGLYGSNFGDARGLICQGDFSITSYDDKWADYQLNNKNYLNVFNREIQNMEVGNDIAKQQAIWQTVAGTLTGAATGATAGVAVGGGAVGGGIGAGVGAAASLAGGIMDYQNMIKMQAENIDFKKDLFGYSLDNIKALPNTIAKITTITANNKLFPFVEYYTCTDEEKLAVANKIRYNGMSVGAIGTINDYVANAWDYEYESHIIEDRCYIKGQIIDVSSLDCDYHMANAIATELNKGIYIRGDS